MLFAIVTSFLALLSLAASALAAPHQILHRRFNKTRHWHGVHAHQVLARRLIHELETTLEGRVPLAGKTPAALPDSDEAETDTPVVVAGTMYKAPDGAIHVAWQHQHKSDEKSTTPWVWKWLKSPSKSVQPSLLPTKEPGTLGNIFHEILRRDNPIASDPKLEGIKTRGNPLLAWFEGLLKRKDCNNKMRVKRGKIHLYGYPHVEGEKELEHSVMTS